VSDLKQDDDGLLVFENNAIPIVTGADEVKQRIRQRLLAVQGEWFMDRSDGLPWFTELFEKNPQNAQAILTRAVLETPGVLDLLEMSFEQDVETRTATVQIRVSTSDGEIALEVGNG